MDEDLLFPKELEEDIVKEPIKILEDVILKRIPSEVVSQPENISKIIENQDQQILNIEKAKSIFKFLAEQKKKIVFLKNSILHLKSFVQIKDNFCDTKTKRAGGVPTCMIVRKYIAIGTSKGVVFIYDHFQNVQMMFGTREGVEFGSVTSLDISSTNDLLVVGHQTGHIVIYNFDLKRSVKTIKDIHKKPIYRVNFCGSSKNIVSVDSEGGVQLITLKTVPIVGMVSDNVPITVSNGYKVHDFSVLEKEPTAEHPVDSMKLSAFVTTEMVYIFSAQEGIKKMRTLSPPPNTKAESPLVAWRKVHLDTRLRNKSTEQVWIKKDPMLAVHWGPLFQLYQLSILPNSNDIDLTPVLEVVLEFTGKAMEWLSPQILVFLTNNEEIRLFDAFTLQTLQTHSLQSIQPYWTLLLENGPLTQKTATGVVKKEKGANYLNSFCVNLGRFYVIGSEGLVEGRVLSWEERLNNLLVEHKWFDAIALALDFFEGSLQAVSGLPKDPIMLNKLLNTKITEILNSYVNFYIKSQKTEELNLLALNTISCCVNIKREDVLFGDLLEQFQNEKLEDLFIENLIPFVYSGKIRKIPTTAVDRIIRCCLRMDHFDVIEKVLLHLEVQSLDLLSISTLLRSHLSSLTFYLLPVTLNNFIIPLNDYFNFLLPLTLRPSINPQTATILTYHTTKILHYLKSIFSGHYYLFPSKPITRSFDEKLDEVLLFLFVEKLEGFSWRFPRVVGLLKWNSREFYKVLSVPFDKKLKPEAKLKGIILVLLELVVDRKIPADVGDPSECKVSTLFTLEQQGDLFLFISRYISSGLLMVDDYILQRMVSFFVGCKEPYRFKEREMALLNLVQFFNSTPASETKPKENPFDSDSDEDDVKPISCSQIFSYDYLIQKLNDAKFYQVCDYYYMFTREYSKVIQSRIASPDFHVGLYDFIKNLLTNKVPNVQLKKIEEDELRYTVIEKIKELLEIDYLKTSELIVLCFQHKHKQILTVLNDYPALLYKYLKGIDTLFLKQSQNTEMSSEYEEKEIISVPPSMMENEEDTYFDLMCKFEPKNTIQFLHSHHRYHIRHCLENAQRYNLFETVAILLEKDGNVNDAISTYIQLIGDKIKVLEQEIPSSNELLVIADDHSFPSLPSEKELRDTVSGCINILKQNHNTLNESLNQKLWSALINCLVSVINKYRDTQVAGRGLPATEVQTAKRYRPSNLTRKQVIRGAPIKKERGPVVMRNHRMKRGLTILIKEVINSMMNYVRFDAILNTIHENHSKDRFGEFRTIFMTLLNVTNDELRMLNMCYQLLLENAFQLQSSIVRFRALPVSPENVEFVSKTLRSDLSRTEKHKNPTTSVTEEKTLLEKMQILKDSRSSGREERIQMAYSLLPKKTENNVQFRMRVAIAKSIHFTEPRKRKNSVSSSRLIKRELSLTEASNLGLNDKKDE